MAFDFELLEEQDPSLPEGTDSAPATEGPAADAKPASSLPAVGRALERRPPLPVPAAAYSLRELHVRLATPGAGLVAELRLPAAATVAELKLEVERLLGILPAEQRLAAATTVLDSDTALHELAERPTGRLDITVVHVPCAARVALSGCRDGTMKLWDLDCQAELSELRAGHGPVTCVAVDWPGRRALAGGEDCCLRMWDLERKRPVRELLGHTGRINALDADWDAGLALSGSSDSTLRSWDLKLGVSIQEFKGHTGAVLCIGFDAALSVAISGSVDCTMRVWSLETGEMVQEIHGHQTAVSCIVADFAGHFALTGGFATLRMWDLRGYAWHSDLSGHTAEVSCIAVHWPTRRALSGSGDSTLRLWGPSVGGRDKVPIFYNAARPLTCHAVLQAQHRVTCLAVDWEAGQAISGGHTGVLQVWDLLAGQLLVQLSGHLGGGVLCLAVDAGFNRSKTAAGGMEPTRPAPRAVERVEGWVINPLFC